MSLCEVCESFDFGQDKSRMFGTILGVYDELVSRSDSGCESCKFFCAILQSSRRWKTRLEELSQKVVVFNHLSLDARDPEELNSIRFSSANDMAFDMCAPEGAEDGDLDSVRIIPVDQRDEKCFAQILSWISGCSEHDSCSKPEPVVLPRKIIEISSDPTVAPRVCQSERKLGTYVVLSYCSGGDEHPIRSISEISNFPATLDLQSLPSTVADAIEITRRLGYQYLWIRDFHSSEDESGEDASELVDVYGRAVLMLSATTGEDANSGIFHDRHVLYSPALGSNKDRYLRQQLLHWSLDIEESPLAARGWAILEKLLAPRIVHFTQRQMIWECASGYQYEASRVDDKKVESDNGREWHRKKVVQPYIENALQNRPKNIEKLDNHADNIKQLERLEAWHHCIDEFSSGFLSAPSHKLLAVAPLASAIDDGNMGQYLAGLWSDNIAFGLAWSRGYALLKPAQEYRAPSWSWASVDGPVQSLALGWPKNMMQDHAQDPGWINKYQPKLISYHMVPSNTLKPYGGVLEGSHIVVAGSCIGFQKLSEAFNSAGKFSLRMVLDQSQMFDCPCCHPRPAEQQEADSAKFNNEIEHHVCMIVQGDAWRTGDKWSLDRGFCDLLVLKASPANNSFTRVGFLRIKQEMFEKSVDLHNDFDALGWERRELKLI